LASPLRNQPEPEDQRNVIIATILVAVIMFAWIFWFSPSSQQQQSPQATGPGDTTEQTEQPPTAADTASDDAPADTTPAPTADAEEAPPDQAAPDQAAPPEAPEADSVTAAALEGEERSIVVETDLYTAVLSTKGGTIQRFTLKEYKDFNQEDPVQIVDTTAGEDAVALVHDPHPAPGRYAIALLRGRHRRRHASSGGRTRLAYV
jgi:membrane protein insertase, YidC/Oxa1 family, N-terminal domain